MTRIHEFTGKNQKECEGSKALLQALEVSARAQPVPAMSCSAGSGAAAMPRFKEKS